MNTMRDRKAIAKAEAKRDAEEAKLSVEEQIRRLWQRQDPVAASPKLLAARFNMRRSAIKDIIHPSRIKKRASKLKEQNKEQPDAGD